MLTTSAKTTFIESQTHQRARGKGELVAQSKDRQTRINRLFQKGCAKIRVPRSSQSLGGGECLEAIMINTSGGMTGGDRLDWRFDSGAHGKMTITTQACERVYKSTGDAARMRVQLAAGAQARLNWVPQETILFDGANLCRSIELDLDDTAEALLVEPIIFGRHAMGENDIYGTVHDRWRIRRQGRLIHAEDFRLTGDLSRKLEGKFLTGGHGAMATCLLLSEQAEALLNQARHILDDGNRLAICGGAVSHWNGKLLARIVAKDSYALRKTLVPLMQLLNGNVNLPKIWAS